MSLFLDNDVLAKLASWDLLEDGTKACGFGFADVRILPTTRFWLGLAGKKECRYPTDDVDAGDAILVVQAANSPGSVLVTGDKRCIRAVVTAGAFAPFVTLLAGRVLCLEQVLLRTIALLGFDEVKRKVVESNQLDLDTAVRAAFGSGMHADAKNSCGSLERRVKALVKDAGGMLAAQDYHFCDEDGES